MQFITFTQFVNAVRSVDAEFILDYPYVFQELDDEYQASWHTLNTYYKYDKHTLLWECGFNGSVGYGETVLEAKKHCLENDRTNFYEMMANQSQYELQPMY